MKIENLIKSFFKRQKLSKVVVLVSLFLFFSFITLFSAIAFANIKFKNDPANAALKEYLNGKDLAGVKYLSVSGETDLYINYPEEEMRGFADPIVKNPNLISKLNGDTLLIIDVRNNDRSNNFNYYRCTIELENIEQVNVSGIAHVSLGVTKGSSISLKGEDNGRITVKPGRFVPLFNVTGRGDSKFNLLNCDNVIADLKDYSSITLKSNRLNLSGILRNRSYAKVSGNEINTKGLVKKDSSAVIYE